MIVVVAKMADTQMNQSTSSQSSLSSSIASPTEDEVKIKSSEEIAEEMASDFRNFLNFSADREESKFIDSVEMMLTKLDEYFSLVDMIRSDTTLCLSTTIPDIEAKCSELDAIFEKIDRLENFVGIVRQNVAVMEEQVIKAEGELGTVGGLVKKLTSFVSMKRTSPISSTSRSKSSDFTPPPIFTTSEYFSNSEQQSDSNVTGASSTSSSSST